MLKLGTTSASQLVNFALVEALHIPVDAHGNVVTPERSTCSPLFALWSASASRSPALTWTCKRSLDATTLLSATSSSSCAGISPSTIATFSSSIQLVWWPIARDLQLQ